MGICTESLIVTPRQLAAALRAISWTKSQLAQQLQCSRTVVHGWAHSLAVVPDPVARWLTRLADGHTRYPAPRRVLAKQADGTVDKVPYFKHGKGSYETSPEDLQANITAIGWYMSDVAASLDCSHSLVRHWVSGLRPMPAPIAPWLASLARLHARYPPPLDWRKVSRSEAMADID